MLLGAVASTGQVSPAIFFDGGYRLNADDYLAVLKDKIIPWMTEGAGDRHFVFQQDGAPAHTAKKVQDFLANFGTKTCGLHLALTSTRWISAFGSKSRPGPVLLEHQVSPSLRTTSVSSGSTLGGLHYESVICFPTSIGGCY